MTLEGGIQSVSEVTPFVPPGTQVYDAPDMIVGVAEPYGFSEESAGWPVAAGWANAIYPYLQTPGIYGSAASLAIRMTAEPGALVAFDTRNPNIPLAFGFQDPYENPADIVNFGEFGAACGADGRANSAQVQAISRIVRLAMDSRIWARLIVVKGPPHVSLGSEFLTQELGLKHLPLVGRGGPHSLFIADRAGVEEHLRSNFPFDA